MKAGILEIADILVVSKADLAGSHRTVRDLNAMVHSAPAQDGGWIVPVVPVSTVEDTGWSQLGEQIERHRASVRATSPRSAVRDRRNWEIEKRAVAAIARAVDSIGSTAGMTRSDAISSVLARASELTGPR